MKTKTPAYVLQCDSHPIHQTKVLCMFMENKELVDLTVTCGTFSVKVHKCVLAAGSTYFLEHLQKDMTIDRVVIHGIEHYIVKSLIEYMYCGETSIAEEYMDDLVAAAKFFGIRGISVIVPESLGCEHKSESVAESKLATKPPQFLKKNQKAENENEETNSPATLFYEISSAASSSKNGATNLERQRRKSIFDQLFVKDTFIEVANSSNEETVYETPENVLEIQDELKFETLELSHEIENSIKDELKEFLNISNSGGYTTMTVNYENVSGSQDMPLLNYEEEVEYVTAEFQENTSSQYPVQLEAIQEDHPYTFNTTQTLEAGSLNYSHLIQDTVTSDYNYYTETSTIYNTTQTTANEQNSECVANDAEPLNLVAKNNSAGTSNS